MPDGNPQEVLNLTTPDCLAPRFGDLCVELGVDACAVQEWAEAADYRREELMASSLWLNDRLKELADNHAHRAVAFSCNPKTSQHSVVHQAASQSKEIIFPPNFVIAELLKKEDYLSKPLTNTLSKTSRPTLEAVLLTHNQPNQDFDGMAKAVDFLIASDYFPAPGRLKLALDPSSKAESIMLKDFRYSLLFDLPSLGPHPQKPSESLLTYPEWTMLQMVEEILKHGHNGFSFPQDVGLLVSIANDPNLFEVTRRQPILKAFIYEALNHLLLFDSFKSRVLFKPNYSQVFDLWLSEARTQGCAWLESPQSTVALRLRAGFQGEIKAMPPGLRTFFSSNTAPPPARAVAKQTAAKAAEASRPKKPKTHRPPKPAKSPNPKSSANVVPPERPPLPAPEISDPALAMSSWTAPECPHLAFALTNQPSNAVCVLINVGKGENYRKLPINANGQYNTKKPTYKAGSCYQVKIAFGYADQARPDPNAGEAVFEIQIAARPIEVLEDGSRGLGPGAEGIANALEAVFAAMQTHKLEEPYEDLDPGIDGSEEDDVPPAPLEAAEGQNFAELLGLLLDDPLLAQLFVQNCLHQFRRDDQLGTVSFKIDGLARFLKQHGLNGLLTIEHWRGRSLIIDVVKQTCFCAQNPDTPLHSSLCQMLMNFLFKAEATKGLAETKIAEQAAAEKAQVQIAKFWSGERADLAEQLQDGMAQFRSLNLAQWRNFRTKAGPKGNFPFHWERFWNKLRETYPEAEILYKQLWKNNIKVELKPEGTIHFVFNIYGKGFGGNCTDPAGTLHAEASFPRAANDIQIKILKRPQPEAKQGKPVPEVTDPTWQAEAERIGRRLFASFVAPIARDPNGPLQAEQKDAQARHKDAVEKGKTYRSKRSLADREALTGGRKDNIYSLLLRHQLACEGKPYHNGERLVFRVARLNAQGQWENAGTVDNLFGVTGDLALVIQRLKLDFDHDKPVVVPVGAVEEDLGDGRMVTEVDASDLADPAVKRRTEQRQQLAYASIRNAMTDSDWQYLILRVRSTLYDLLPDTEAKRVQLVAELDEVDGEAAPTIGLTKTELMARKLRAAGLSQEGLLGAEDDGKDGGELVRKRAQKCHAWARKEVISHSDDAVGVIDTVLDEAGLSLEQVLDPDTPTRALFEDHFIGNVRWVEYFLDSLEAAKVGLKLTGAYTIGPKALREIVGGLGRTQLKTRQTVAATAKAAADVITEATGTPPDSPPGPAAPPD